MIQWHIDREISRRRETYVEGNVGVSSINKARDEAGIASHCTMDCALGEERRVDVVRCIGWDSSDHVCRV